MHYELGLGGPNGRNCKQLGLLPCSWDVCPGTQLKNADAAKRQCFDV